MDIPQYERIRFWCQKVIPLVYDDSLSYYEQLCKVTDYVNKIGENQNQINDWVNEIGTTIEQMQKDIAYLSSELEKVKNGEYVDLYLDNLIQWIDNNIQQLVGRIVKYVTFGLTADGHFAAYIPESWDFLQFDTIMDGELYGHLVMRW